MGSWNEARRECRYRGGDLALPFSSETNNQIYQHIKVGGDIGVWIGVHRDERKKFITTGGVGVSYTNWNRGEPNNAGGKEDCVEMYALGSAAGMWNDMPCSGYDRRHVCELFV
jgi:hypothetical protein